jgi:8-oxo-dGTP pyrophosphatase MutT (NUDIX family)
VLSLWVPIDSQLLSSETPLLSIERQRCRQEGTGKEDNFYILHCADSVKIVAQSSEGALILVRQFRFGSREFSLESPAGVIECGESPAITAERELLEETGYASPFPLRPIGIVRPNPAFQRNFCHIFFAADCKKVAEQRLDPNEDIAIVLLRPEEVFLKIASGEIDHALSVAAFFLSRDYLSHLS